MARNAIRTNSAVSPVSVVAATRTSCRVARDRRPGMARHLPMIGARACAGWRARAGARACPVLRTRRGSTVMSRSMRRSPGREHFAPRMPSRLTGRQRSGAGKNVLGMSGRRAPRRLEWRTGLAETPRPMRGMLRSRRTRTRSFLLACRRGPGSSPIAGCNLTETGVQRTLGTFRAPARLFEITRFSALTGDSRAATPGHQLIQL